MTNTRSLTRLTMPESEGRQLIKCNPKVPLQEDQMFSTESWPGPVSLNLLWKKVAITVTSYWNQSIWQTESKVVIDLLQLLLITDFYETRPRLDYISQRYPDQCKPLKGNYVVTHYCCFLQENHYWHLFDKFHILPLCQGLQMNDKALYKR